MQATTGISNQLLLIKNNDLFSQMSDEVFNSMDIIHHFKETPVNEYIYFEAHLHNSLYFLKKGHVKIGYYDQDGREVIKEIIGRGDLFGQITLMPNNLEGEFAQAHKSDVSLCMFRVQEFEGLLNKYPQIALRFSRQLGQKMLRVENRMVNLLHKTVVARLYYFFVSLSRQFPEYLNDNKFDKPNIFTHDEISRLIGSSRQTVTTLINEMEGKNLLRFGRQQLIINDVKELQKLLNVV
jgi:CRP/FNR family transcriptional regulator